MGDIRTLGRIGSYKPSGTMEHALLVAEQGELNFCLVSDSRVLAFPNYPPPTPQVEGG